MASLKHRKKYGELEVKCDCGRVHTITQEKKEGEDAIYLMETDDSQLINKPIEKEKLDENKINNSAGSSENDKPKKKGFLNFEL
jgi:hypothetical protein